MGGVKMLWQDILLTFASILFTYSVIPQVCYNYKNKICKIENKFLIITILAELLVCVCFMSMGLYMSGTFCALQMVLWGVIIYQKYLYEIKID